MDRYINLDIPGTNMSVQVKLDDEAVVVDKTIGAKGACPTSYCRLTVIR